MVKHLKINVRGKVQGVFFRASTQNKAHQLGIAGYVKNENSGDVYIEAEAEEDKLQEFINWCNKGPIAARVDEVVFTEGEAKNYTTFEIKKD